MSEQRPRVVAVGEALIQFVRGGDGRFGIGCAGDSFNVAVYLARAGIDAAFATVLGDDPYSDAIRALAAGEGVASALVQRRRAGFPGLAVVDADTAGTRRRYDWGADAPARDLFELPDWGRVAEGLTKAKLVYFSGITLSLYSNTGLGRFLALIEMGRQQGVKVAFDGNFRPRGWRRPGAARAVYGGTNAHPEAWGGGGEGSPETRRRWLMALIGIGAGGVRACPAARRVFVVCRSTRGTAGE